MQINPARKPKVATPALILASAVTVIAATALLALTNTSSGFQLALLWVGAVAVILVVIWSMRIRTQQRWQTSANERWTQLESLKHPGLTTTEVTVLTVNEIQPTGSWITISWNQFEYVQPAWIEALTEPIWPGSVLLIKPDPTQVQPGAPWPPTYRIARDRVLTWAPLV